MQGTRVQALVQEDPTCRRATKPVHHNYYNACLHWQADSPPLHHQGSPSLVFNIHIIEQVQDSMSTTMTFHKHLVWHKNI